MSHGRDASNAPSGIVKNVEPVPVYLTARYTDAAPIRSAPPRTRKPRIAWIGTINNRSDTARGKSSKKPIVCIDTLVENARISLAGYVILIKRMPNQGLYLFTLLLMVYQAKVIIIATDLSCVSGYSLK